MGLGRSPVKICGKSTKPWRASPVAQRELLTGMKKGAPQRPFGIEPPTAYGTRLKFTPVWSATEMSTEDSDLVV